jgi:hypothetical protein
MEVTIYSVGDADNRPEWDYKVGEWVEIIRSGEIVGTGKVVDVSGKYVKVRPYSGVVASYYPGELRKIP